MDRPAMLDGMAVPMRLLSRTYFIKHLYLKKHGHDKHSLAYIFSIPFFGSPFSASIIISMIEKHWLCHLLDPSQMTAPDVHLVWGKQNRLWCYHLCQSLKRHALVGTPAAKHPLWLTSYETKDEEWTRLSPGGLAEVIYHLPKKTPRISDETLSGRCHGPGVTFFVFYNQTHTRAQ